MLLRPPRRRSRRCLEKGGTRAAAPQSETRRRVLLSSLRPHRRQLAASFTCETPSAVGIDALLAPTAVPTGSWYVSLIVQRADLVRSLLDKLPETPACFGTRVRHGGALWLFVGRNDSPADGLAGRPEHTDSVVHDGTWHVQVEGRKQWTLRPTDELELASVGGRQRGRSAAPGGRSGESVVVCEEGDVLVLSTREWWHSTLLPAQRAGELSVSVAREFNLVDGSSGHAGRGRRREQAGAGGEAAGGEEAMTNVEGIFATQRIRAGHLVLTEEDMADCELPASRDPNCEVCEEEGSGMLCLVARRDIASGEFLTVGTDGEG